MSFIKDFAKLGVDVGQSLWVKGATAVGIVDFPVPRNSHMRRTSDNSVSGFYLSGIRTYLPIAVEALRNGVDLNAGVDVLDFGVGGGRQLVHFTRQYPRCRFSACDVDDYAIGFIGANYPSVAAYRNNFEPPLRYADASFDLVYTVSTFSHFPPAGVAAWLAEFARVLRPHGLAMITIEGVHALPAVTELAGDTSLGDRVAADGIVYQEYEWLASEQRRRSLLPVDSHARGLGSSYGNTIMTRDYVATAAAAAGLDLVDYIAGVIDHRQDLAVLRKR